MTQTVVGIFSAVAQARSAEQQLLQSGFTNGMIDISSATVAANAGTQANGDPNGSVKRFFQGLLDSGPEADRYTTAASRNEAIVTVHASTEEQARRAAEILDAAGSIDIDAPDRSTDEQSVKVVQENLQVGKRTVEAGGTRLRSRIVEREVSQDIRLREERVVVERRPVDRPANAADLAAFHDGQIEIVERAEVPVVSKEARVVEEVRLRKEETERTETVKDTVRSTEVEVEKIDGKSQAPKGPR